MRIEYFPDTDSLYIDLAERPGVDTREVGDGTVHITPQECRPRISLNAMPIDAPATDVRRAPYQCVWTALRLRRGLANHERPFALPVT